MCPSIRCILWSYGIRSKRIRDRLLTMLRNDTNIENKSNYENVEACHLGYDGFYNGNEERHISILIACLQEPPLLEHLGSPTHTLPIYIMYGIVSENGITILLPRPPELKSLELMEFHVPNQTQNHPFFENLCNYFQHVDQLEMRFTVRPISLLKTNQIIYQTWLKPSAVNYINFDKVHPDLNRKNISCPT